MEIGLELEVELSSMFSERAGCEVDSHAEQPHWHEGDGEWYVSHRPCPFCGYDAPTILICAKFKETLEEMLYTATVPCQECRRRLIVGEVVTGFEKRGK